MFKTETTDRLISLAQRYPSPHNTQPAVWKIARNGDVCLWSDESRRLFVGDPERRDHLVSLGAAWECLNVAASGLGLKLVDESPVASPAVIKGNESFPVMQARLEISAESKDPLFDQIEQRRCYRGVFKETLSGQKLKELAATGWSIVSAEHNAVCGQIHDHATSKFMAHPSFVSELYHWLRLRDSHPSYHQDGLNREAMSLNSFEGYMASWLLKPNVFKFLQALKLGSVVTTELPQIKSSSGIAFMTAAAQEAPFQSGRRLMRLWLKMSELGICGCPISSTTDDPDSRRQLLSLAGMPADTNVIIALRIGPTPRAVYLSPRLAAKTSDLEKLEKF